VALAVHSSWPQERIDEVTTKETRFETSIRMKCSQKFKDAMKTVAAEWDAEKPGKFEMSGVLRTLGEREIRRRARKRQREPEAKRG